MEKIKNKNSVYPALDSCHQNRRPYWNNSPQSLFWRQFNIYFLVTLISSDNVHQDKQRQSISPAGTRTTIKTTDRGSKPSLYIFIKFAVLSLQRQGTALRSHVTIPMCTQCFSMYLALPGAAHRQCMEYRSSHCIDSSALPSFTCIHLHMLPACRSWMAPGI